MATAAASSTHWIDRSIVGSLARNLANAATSENEHFLEKRGATLCRALFRYYSGLVRSPLCIESRRRLSRRSFRAVELAVGCIVLLTLGCDKDPAEDQGDEDTSGVPQCVDVETGECAMLYQPTWDNVFQQTLQPRCSTGQGACHGNPDANGARNGLVLSDPDEAYSILLGEGMGTAFVEPGNPACSPLVVRLDTDDPLLRMPPAGNPLDERERCAIRRWISDGAAR